MESIIDVSKSPPSLQDITRAAILKYSNYTIQTYASLTNWISWNSLDYLSKVRELLTTTVKVSGTIYTGEHEQKEKCNETKSIILSNKLGQHFLSVLLEPYKKNVREHHPTKCQCNQLLDNDISHCFAWKQPAFTIQRQDKKKKNITWIRLDSLNYPDWYLEWTIDWNLVTPKSFVLTQKEDNFVMKIWFSILNFFL